MTKMGRLGGRVAIVTGAGSGIGRATAKLFAAEGAKVAVVSHDPDAVAAVVAEIEHAGGTAFGVICDVSDAWQTEGAVLDAVYRFGGIDILVNNVFDPLIARAGIVDLPVEQLRRSFETRPVAYLRLMQACFPHLRASGHGRVINFASVAGVAGMMGSGPYAMAGEAVRALTRVAAREWGSYGITVNNVLLAGHAHDGMVPAGISAPATPPGCPGPAGDDIAPVALFLASRDGQFLTGYSLSPDGGKMIDAAR